MVWKPGSFLISHTHSAPSGYLLPSTGEEMLPLPPWNTPPQPREWVETVNSKPDPLRLSASEWNSSQRLLDMDLRGVAVFGVGVSVPHLVKMTGESGVAPLRRRR